MGEFEKALKIEGLRGILKRIEESYPNYKYAKLLLYSDGSGCVSVEESDYCGDVTKLELFGFDTLQELFAEFGG